ncbi:hypothetical protein Rsub_07400 [Raphidocelis subcapitata]|uniref:Uncharacterized protein n=1 Tax=Raphidocelis subcapitata TaxID=307507 RepID=A0A2V0P470_9CHLO|nr:hypothetical protein Rsub_07400 [Raphidocelis subcapitata]|eukprot:GBF94664.1 hypothetical protein Rsub_07400 [Raphidocelis subcapitata]
MYFGCQGCCAKTRWMVWTVSLIGAAALLAIGLVKTVPSLKVLFQCTTKENSLLDSGACWKAYWSTDMTWFILSAVGLGCLILSTFACCCFVCAKSPNSKRKDQFIQGDGYDTAPHGDQYGHPAPARGAKGSSNV